MSKSDVIRAIMDSSFREKFMNENNMTNEDFNKLIDSHTCELTPLGMI